jgi:hypothetical protein
MVKESTSILRDSAQHELHATGAEVHVLNRELLFYNSNKTGLQYLNIPAA